MVIDDRCQCVRAAQWAVENIAKKSVSRQLRRRMEFAHKKQAPPYRLDQ